MNKTSINKLKLINFMII